MRSQDSFDLSLRLEHPAVIYSGDCVRVLAALKSDQLVNFEVNFPLQAAYEVIACQRGPLRLQASHYYQSIEWTLQVKEPGSIYLPPLQAELTGRNRQQTVSTEALSFEVKASTQTLYDDKALNLPKSEDSLSEPSPAWLLLPLFLISLMAVVVRFRKRGNTGLQAQKAVDKTPQTTQGEQLLTSEIAAAKLSKIASTAPLELRLQLEALAYQKMSHSQRMALTQATKAYLEP